MSKHYKKYGRRSQRKKVHKRFYDLAGQSVDGLGNRNPAHPHPEVAGLKDGGRKPSDPIN